MPYPPYIHGQFYLELGMDKVKTTPAYPGFIHQSIGSKLLLRYALYMQTQSFICQCIKYKQINLGYPGLCGLYPHPIAQQRANLFMDTDWIKCGDKHHLIQLLLLSNLDKPQIQPSQFRDWGGLTAVGTRQSADKVLGLYKQQISHG